MPIQTEWASMEPSSFIRVILNLSHKGEVTMEMVKVYRIEDKENGKGPYANDHVSYMDKEHRDMPPPFFDFDQDAYSIMRNEWDSHTHYAMPDLETLFDFWRLRTRKRLFKHGFVIAVYTVAKEYVFEGQSGLQVAFHKPKATKVSEHPLLRTVSWNNDLQ
jgi:hypothetical protein